MKYVKVEWPESQQFMDNEECYMAIPIDPISCKPYGHTCMVPEELYNKLQFPKKYEDTNLGTIICYENYAVVNGTTNYWYDLTDVKKGNIALIYDGTNWHTSKIVACSKSFPILLEDSEFLIGINCEFIGHNDPEMPF